MGPETVCRDLAAKQPNLVVNVSKGTSLFYAYMARFGNDKTEFTRSKIQTSSLKKNIDVSDGVLVIRSPILSTRNVDSVIGYCKLGKWEPNCAVKGSKATAKPHVVVEVPFKNIREDVERVMEFIRDSKIRSLCVTGSSPEIYNFKESSWHAMLKGFFEPLMERINEDCTSPLFHQEVKAELSASPAMDNLFETLSLPTLTARQAEEYPREISSVEEVSPCLVVPETPMTTIALQPPSLKRPTRVAQLHMFSRLTRKYPTFRELIEEAANEGREYPALSLIHI